MQKRLFCLYIFSVAWNFQLVNPASIIKNSNEVQSNRDIQSFRGLFVDSLSKLSDTETSKLIEDVEKDYAEASSSFKVPTVSNAAARDQRDAPPLRTTWNNTKSELKKLRSTLKQTRKSATSFIANFIMRLMAFLARTFERINGLINRGSGFLSKLGTRLSGTGSSDDSTLVSSSGDGYSSSSSADEGYGGSVIAKFLGGWSAPSASSSWGYSDSVKYTSESGWSEPVKSHGYWSFPSRFKRESS